MESKFDLLERYLMDEMSVREQIEFEEVLRADPELMKEFQLRREINNALIEEDIIDLRETLEEITSEKQHKSRKLFMYSAAAAVIVLLIVISGTLLQPERLSQSDIINQYYSVYPPVMSFRSPVDQNEIESLLYKAFHFYDDKNYKEASIYFNTVFQMDSLNSMSQFYLSLCNIELNNLELAEEYLSNLILKQDHIFLEQSNWYLAMVFIKQGNISKAESVLNRIVDKEMIQKNEAKTILKNLK